ncbi:MAG TPA: sugar transferase [Acidobacteriaceae bacterium]|jgi:lipopolysaccharide/colanic/teichoic acid biosynthesis glycosyltransferase
MNNPEHMIPPAYAALPKEHSSLASGAPEDSTSAKPALFLAWSNAHEIAAGQAGYESSATSGHLAGTPPFPDRNGWRDRGLWLLHDAFVRREGWSHLRAMPMSIPVPDPLAHRRAYSAAKRAMDVLGAIVLLALLAPFLLLVALLVRLDSPGPALFRQRRAGRDGVEFLLWKFRSMHVDAPDYAPSPTSNLDPRLTRIGRLIRRVSIDELPQLINVLKGEMSLVGPRPEMPFIVERYTPLERARLAVKPGITGLWQVSPARAMPIHENLQYDLHYIHHQNLTLDSAILLRTIAAVIRGVGAV